MKKKMVCVLLVASFAFLQISIRAHSEETKTLSGEELVQSYAGKTIDEMITLLGNPTEVKEKQGKETRRESPVEIYIWKWSEIDKIPTRIVHDLKKGTTPYYVDFVKVKTEEGKITEIHLKANNRFVVP